MTHEAKFNRTDVAVMSLPYGDVILCHHWSLWLLLRLAVAPGSAVITGEAAIIHFLLVSHVIHGQDGYRSLLGLIRYMEEWG